MSRTRRSRRKSRSQPQGDRRRCGPYVRSKTGVTARVGSIRKKDKTFCLFFWDPTEKDYTLSGGGRWTPEELDEAGVRHLQRKPKPGER